MKTKFIALLLLLLAIPSIAIGAQKTITTYTWDSNINASPVATTSLPPANSQLFSVSSSNVVTALNTAGTGNQVASITYTDSNNCQTVWAAFQNYTYVTDPDNTGCLMGSLIVPLSTSSTNGTGQLQSTWTTNGSVSYDVQVKVGWYQTLVYAAQGINIRWQQSSTSGKYQGYGISFLNFNSQTSCSSSNSDYIPYVIKPGTNNSLRGTLLIVLWQQKVVNGVEHRNWLAYAILGVPGGTMNDPKVIGNQTGADSATITDNVTLLVRVEDIISGSNRYNDIKLYYGDPSTNTSRTSGTRGNDTVATNINRGVYPPKCSASGFPSWPSNILEPYSSTNQALTYWSYLIWYAATPYVANNMVIPVNRLASDGLAHSYKCTTAGTTGYSQPTWPVASGATVSDGSVVWSENGTNRPTKYDYFTLLSANPLIANNAVSMVINTSYVNDIVSNNNPTATVVLQADRATIRTTDFTLATYPSTQPEIALHGMGSLTGSSTVAFNDLAVQILGRRE